MKPLALAITLCVGLTSHALAAEQAHAEDKGDCKDAAQNSDRPPPDSGIYGSLAREGASYSKISAPSYPAAALKRRIVGTVFVHVWIRKDRTVSKATVEKVYPETASTLASGLTDVVRTWLFNPVEEHNVPMESEVIVPVRFSVKDRSAPPAPEFELASPSLPMLDTIEVRGG